MKGFKVLPNSASKMRTLYTNALFLRKGSRFCQIWPQKSEPFACFCQIWPQKSEPFACRANSPSPPAPQTPFREPLKKNPVLGTFPGKSACLSHELGGSGLVDSPLMRGTRCSRRNLWMLFPEKRKPNV